MQFMVYGPTQYTIKCFQLTSVFYSNATDFGGRIVVNP